MVVLTTRSNLNPLMPNPEEMEALRQALGRRWPEASPTAIADALEQLKRDHPGVLPPVEG